MDHEKAMAPPPDFARTMSRAVEGTKAMALARKILSCLKSLVNWEFGTANTPTESTASEMTLIGPTAAADPSAAAMGLAKANIAPASIALDKTETVATVGARRSISRSALTRHAETPSSPMLDTIAKAVSATAKTPKSCGERICATTAVIKTLAKRSNTLLAATQRAPLRTLAESDCESLPAGLGSET